MSRLFYEKQVTQESGPATKRVMTPLILEPAKPDPKEVAEKIAKLIPVEIIAGYSTLIGFAVLVPDKLIYMQIPIQTACFIVSFAAGLILTPVYLSAMADAEKPKIMHLVVSTLAFPFWAYLTSGAAVFGTAYQPSLAGFAVALFSLVTAWIPLDR